MIKKRLQKKVVCAFFIYFVFLVFILSAQRTKSASDYFAAGKTFQDAQDWYSAIGQYQEAVRQNPSYAQAWFALAECAYALGEYDLALGYIESAQKLKNDSSAQNLKGFIFIALNKLSEARSLFTDILKQYPNDTEARFGLAELDIFDGRISGAETLYLDALKRQPENRRALLSLALISQALGKKEIAREYINQSLRYHADTPEVYYFAAFLSAQDSQWQSAENRVRSAIQLQPDYDAAYELLATVFFAQKRWAEVIDICDYRISRNRNLQSAWYVKAIALSYSDKKDEAIAAFQTGLEIDPEDEVMRAAAEQLVCSLPIEDARRVFWAAWHVKKATEAAQKFMFEQAKYEYRRALTIDPQNTNVRLLYAQILLQEGYPQIYLSQLEFIKTQGNTSVAVLDKIDAYQSLLQNSLANQWNIDPFYLDKMRWNFGLYVLSGSVQMLHPKADLVTASMLAEVLGANGTINAVAQAEQVSGYADAFRLARQNKQDYFGIVSFEENDRELTISCAFYVGRTGSEAVTYRVYRIGNGRFAEALRRIQQSVYAALPLHGKIIARNGYTALVDLGKVDGLAEKSAFTIVKNGQVTTADKGFGLVYSPENVFGTLTFDSVSEEIAQGQIKQSGFFDRANIGDQVVSNMEEKDKQKQFPILDMQKPALINLIRSVY